MFGLSQTEKWITVYFFLNLRVQEINKVETLYSNIKA